jgi:aminoglycoside/choline kinase family phosphotransferase
MEGDWKGFVGEWMVKAGMPGGFDREPLAGDASNRRYFRVRFSEGDLIPAVLMQKNAGEGFKKSEEAVSGGGAGPPGDPFILIARFLLSKGIPVPSLYHVRESGELILQEDLGDHTLAGRLSGSPEESETLTEKVLLLLVSLQKISWEEELPWLSGRRFSRDLIRWEFEHFVEYGLAGATESALAGIRKAFDHESELLARESSPVLVHRDYHSRNIMVREDGSLGLIDFQDLLLGSPFYDLASFLFDAYRSLPMEEVRRWLARYRELAVEEGVLPGSLSLEQASASLFRHAFQRNLKACGRFFYIADVKGNPSFLRSVSGTHRNLERLARALPDLAPIYGQILPFLRKPSGEQEV